MPLIWYIYATYELNGINHMTTSAVHMALKHANANADTKC